MKLPPELDWLQRVFVWFYSLYGNARFIKHFRGIPVFAVNRLLPKWAAGQALGEVIFVREDIQHEQRWVLLHHERAHVMQYRKEKGWFWVKYFMQYLNNRFLRGMTHMRAYESITYEIQARLAEYEYWEHQVMPEEAFD